MSSCVSHDFLLEHFNRTLDVWDRWHSYTRGYFFETSKVQSVQVVYKMKQNMWAQTKVHELWEHTRGDKRAKPMQKPGTKMAVWGVWCSEKKKKFKKKKKYRLVDVLEQKSTYLPVYANTSHYHQRTCYP